VGGLVLIFWAIVWLRGFRQDKIPPGSHVALKIIEDLPNHFDGSIVCSSLLGWVKWASFEGKLEGYEFSLKFDAYERHGKGRFYLTLYSDYKSKFIILITTWNQGPGIFTKKIKTGNPNFDKQFVIYSNNPDKAKQLFYDDTNRNSLLRIKRNKWNPPHIVKNKITTERDFEEGEIIDHMLLEETLKDMIILSENIRKQVVHTR
jgi:hypothetical protein